jgi:thiamine pyrophosphate-dependent acetolactate synthase large subunit-like protein
MATIITSSEVPKYVPGAVTAASDDLGWNGVWLRGYRYGAMDVIVPPVRDFTIVAYCRGATFMERQCEGAWAKTHCAPGDVSLLSRSQRSHWHWTEEIEVSHVYLSENLVSGICAEVTGRCIADVRLQDVLKSQDPIVTAAVAGITREAQQQALGGTLYNDITTAAYSGRFDLSRFITVGLNDVRIGDKIIPNVRLADVLTELAELKPSSTPYRGTPQALAPVSGSPSDKITMDALYPRYAAFLRTGDTVVLETGSSSLSVTPTIFPDGVRVEAQVLWGSIGWATPAAFGVALADPSRRTILITGEGSHQLTANDIGAMGRFGANVIVFVLNNDGYLIERALEENPDWTYNDLAPWKYAELPKALGCANWYTARVTSLGELDEAMKAARASKSGAYIEIIGGRMDMPPALAFAHGRLKSMYGDAP